MFPIQPRFQCNRLAQCAIKSGLSRSPIKFGALSLPQKLKFEMARFYTPETQNTVEGILRQLRMTAIDIQAYLEKTEKAKKTNTQTEPTAVLVEGVYGIVNELEVDLLSVLLKSIHAGAEASVIRTKAESLLTQIANTEAYIPSHSLFDILTKMVSKGTLPDRTTLGHFDTNKRGVLGA